MNRTQAKARAVELGISKDEARCFGNLSKTQTWLDAIAAHEAKQQEPMLLSTASESGDGEATSVLELPHSSTMVDESVSPTSVAKTPELVFEDPWIEDTGESETDGVNDDLQETVAPASTTLIYPVLVFFVMLWAACQLLLGVASLLAVWLNHLAQFIQAHRAVRGVDKVATGCRPGIAPCKIGDSSAAELLAV